MIWLWIGIAVVVVAAGALVPVVMGRRHHRLRSNDEAVAARSRYHMLGHYVEELEQVDDDDDAAALLKSARERWHTTGSMLARARTEEDFLLAERIARDGLVAVAEAYALLGRPGPKLPET